ncbi:MAG: ribosome maturation factor RimP [Actinobacteria bacterium]|nr:ribosome maturation factor RimP [Actinomycetota bacterium]
MGAEEQIAEALLPTVQAAGLEIWDVERSGTSVRVLVERPGGVDLDTIAELSPSVSAVLDQREDLVPTGRYVLEVSSPGLERRLRQPAHFARCIGQEVAVKTASEVSGSRRLEGTLVGADDHEIALRVAAGDGEQLVRVPLGTVTRAHTVFNWGPTERSRQGGRPPRAHRSQPKGDS